MKQKIKVKIRLKKEMSPLRKDQIIETTESNARDLIKNNLAEEVK